MKVNSRKTNAIYPWIAFITCSLISLVIIGLIANTSGLYVKSIADDLQVSYAQVQFSFTCQSLAGAVVMMFFGSLYKRCSIRKSMGSLVGLISIGLFICSKSANIYHIYIGYIFIGLSTTALNAIILPSLMSQWFHRKLGMYLGIALSLSGIGGALFNPLIGNIIAAYSWRESYAFVSILCFALLMPCCLIVRKQPDPDHLAYGFQADDGTSVSRSGVEYDRVKGTKTLHKVIFLAILLQLAAGMIQLISVHMSSRGYSIRQGSQVASIALLGAALGKVVFGKLMDISRTFKFILVYMLGGALGWLGMILLPGDQFNLLSGLMLGSAQAIILVGLPLTVTYLYGNKDYSRIYAKIMMPGTYISAFAATLYGAVFDLTNSYTLPFILGVAFYLIATPMLYSVLKQASGLKAKHIEPGSEH